MWERVLSLFYRWENEVCTATFPTYYVLKNAGVWYLSRCLLERQGIGEEGWILWPKMFGKCCFIKSSIISFCTISPRPYQESMLKDFEKSFSKENLFKFVNLVFPKHAWSQNHFFSGRYWKTVYSVVQIMVLGITVLEYWPAKVAWQVEPGVRPSSACPPTLSSHAYPSASRHLESAAIFPWLHHSDIVMTFFKCQILSNQVWYLFPFQYERWNKYYHHHSIVH